MDVDGDVDGSLAQALSCMATSDKEVLVRQFQQILGQNHVLTPEACAFFLDMNNWNLNAALGAYYDYGSPNTIGMPPPEYTTRLPSMQFVQDITIGEGESVPPSTRFVKTWRVRNNGTEAWPAGCYIAYMEGDKLSDVTRSWVQPLRAGEEGNVSVEMMSPAMRGIYQSRWQLNTSSGIPFGESIWCIITVDDMGILDITQQLASAPLGSRPNTSDQRNPFAGGTRFRSHSEREGFCGDNLEVVTSAGGSMDNLSFDSPASPNGSCSLFNAVVSRLPQLQNSTTTGSSGAPHSTSEPIEIGNFMDESPDVPPCTPCTPPQ
uniref:N_BRCA1_IG domain-containing protein n=2 Tax=Ascaris TaxID=6251 RepID=A0A0M3HRS2_ASCLU